MIWFGPPALPWYLRWLILVVMAPAELWLRVRDRFPRRRPKPAQYVGSGWLMFPVPWYLRWMLWFDRSSKR